MSAQAQEKARKYEAIQTEDEAILLARKEGYPEGQIQANTPGWMQHYHNTAATLRILTKHTC